MRYSRLAGTGCLAAPMAPNGDRATTTASVCA